MQNKTESLKWNLYVLFLNTEKTALTLVGGFLRWLGSLIYHEVSGLSSSGFGPELVFDILEIIICIMLV